MNKLAFVRLAPLVALQSVVASAALAQTPDSSDPEALINRGLDAREKGDDETALREFERAWALKQAPRTRAQIALAEQALGRWVEAEAHLSEALGSATDPWIARNAAVLEKARETVRERLGSLDIRGGKPGSEVRVNGVKVATLPLQSPVRVVAGTVVLEVTLAAHLPVSRAVIVPAKGLARETIALVPVPQEIRSAPVVQPTVTIARNPDPTRDEPTAGAWKRPAAYGSFGLAGLSLVLGVMSHIQRESKASDYSNMPCGPGIPACDSLKEEGDAAQTRAIIGYLGAAVFGGAGAWLLWTAPAPSDGASRTALLRCLPWTGDGKAPSVGVGCMGHF